MLDTSNPLRGPSRHPSGLQPAQDSVSYGTTRCPAAPAPCLQLCSPAPPATPRADVPLIPPKDTVPGEAASGGGPSPSGSPRPRPRPPHRPPPAVPAPPGRQEARCQSGAAPLPAAGVCALGRAELLLMRGPGWGRSGLREAAMNAFGVAAPLPGSSAAAGTRHGGGESLEKIDMSLGEQRGWGGRCGQQSGGVRAEPSAGDGEGRKEPNGAEPGTGAGGTNWGGGVGRGKDGTLPQRERSGGEGGAGGWARGESRTCVPGVSPGAARIRGSRSLAGKSRRPFVSLGGLSPPRTAALPAFGPVRPSGLGPQAGGP